MLVYLMCGKGYNKMFLFLVSDEDVFLMRAFIKLGLKGENTEKPQIWLYILTSCFKIPLFKYSLMCVMFPGTKTLQVLVQDFSSKIVCGSWDKNVNINLI